MSFPIEFAEKGGWIAPIINITGNLAVLAIGGISLGTISFLAFKALGYAKIAATIASAVPVSIVAFGAAETVGGALALALIIALACKGIGKILSSRRGQYSLYNDS